MGRCFAYRHIFSGAQAQLLSHVQLFCDAMDCSLPGSSLHGISQARILDWVAISFSRGSPQPRDQTYVSCITGGFFIIEPLGSLFSGNDVCKIPSSDDQIVVWTTQQFIHVLLPHSVSERQCRWWDPGSQGPPCPLVNFNPKKNAASPFYLLKFHAFNIPSLPILSFLLDQSASIFLKAESFYKVLCWEPTPKELNHSLCRRIPGTSIFWSF